MLFSVRYVSVYKISISLLLIATKPGKSELIILVKQEFTRYFETHCSTIVFIFRDHFVHDETLCFFVLNNKNPSHECACQIFHWPEQ